MGGMGGTGGKVARVAREGRGGKERAVAMGATERMEGMVQEGTQVMEGTEGILRAGETPVPEAAEGVQG